MTYSIMMMFFFALGGVILTLAKNKLIFCLVYVKCFIVFIIIGGFYFLLFKFNGEELFVFPDENLYVRDETSILAFAKYVKLVADSVGYEFIRVSNLFVFSSSIALLASSFYQTKYNSNYKLLFLFIVIFGAFVGTYWSFFILKESITVLGITLLIYSYTSRNNILLFSSVFWLLIGRPDLILLYFGVLAATVLYNRSRLSFYLSCCVIIISLIFFMDSTISKPIKLFILSRRNGIEEFSFDDASIAISSLGFFGFVFSREYYDAIVTNLNSTFNPFYKFNAFASLLKLFNVLTVSILLRTFIKTRFTDQIVVFSIASVIGLLLTHSVHRYLNTILIPISVYCIYCLSYYEDKYKKSKNISYCSSI